VNPCALATSPSGPRYCTASVNPGYAATGSAAIHQGLNAIAARRARNVLVVGVEKMTELTGPAVGDILISAHTHSRYVYFPLETVVSVVRPLRDHQSVEIGVIERHQDTPIDRGLDSCANRFGQRQRSPEPGVLQRQLRIRVVGDLDLGHPVGGIGVAARRSSARDRRLWSSAGRGKTSMSAVSLNMAATLACGRGGCDR